jgi:hypothetical protein
MNIETGDAHPPDGQDAGHMTGLPCRIILKGEVSDRLEPAFHGLSLQHRAGYTQLHGTLADQSQLQGLLNRLFDLGIQLVSVSTTRCVPPDRPATPA